MKEVRFAFLLVFIEIVFAYIVILSANLHNLIEIEWKYRWIDDVCYFSTWVEFGIFFWENRERRLRFISTVCVLCAICWVNHFCQIVYFAYIKFRDIRLLIKVSSIFVYKFAKWFEARREERERGIERDFLMDWLCRGDVIWYTRTNYADVDLKADINGKNQKYTNVCVCVCMRLFDVS